MIAFAIPMQAQQQQNGIGLNMGYRGDYGLEGTLSYERFVGLRHLVRASAGLRSRSGYTLGLSYQYAVLNKPKFKILTGLGVERLSIDGALYGSSNRLTKTYAILPIDVRYRLSDQFWLNAGISPELRTLSGTNKISQDYDFTIRLGCIYRF